MPNFCRQRHFVRAANAYVVPLWDLTARWLPEELAAHEVKKFVPEERAAMKSKAAKAVEGEQGEEEAEEEDEGLSDSEQSEITWEGPLGGSSRAWCRGAVDSALVLLRRLQVPGEKSTYGLGISAALMPPETLQEGSDVSMDRRLAQIIRTQEPCWAVCALRSGHFAGAVFQGQQALVHKAIHRYTVRAKAGGAQSACDSGKKVKSVGSSPLGALF